MSDAYLELRLRKYVTGFSSEDTITEEWFIHIQEICRQSPAISLHPIQQKQDTTKAKTCGKPPTIDFCFRDEFESQSYFGAECKLLDEGNTTLLNAYLDLVKGIGRFLDGRYATHTGAGAMVGYVRSGDCGAVAKSISECIQDLEGKPTLRKSQPLENFDQLYESRHNRKLPIADFLCYHLLFGFNCSAA